MKKPKWHEIGQEDITISWDISKTDKPIVVIGIKLNDKIYTSKIFSSETGSVNLRETVCEILANIESKEEKSEINLYK